MYSMNTQSTATCVLISSNMKVYYRPVEPVIMTNGINKDVCGSKLPLTKFLAYLVHCVCFCHLLNTQYCYLCPNFLQYTNRGIIFLCPNGRYNLPICSPSLTSHLTPLYTPLSAHTPSQTPHTHLPPSYMCYS